MTDKISDDNKPKLVHLSLPLPINPQLMGINGTVESTKDAKSSNPRKKRSLFITITLILSGFFASAGVMLFSSVGGLVIGWISSFFTSLTGWDVLIVSLFLAAVFWFLAAVLYVKHKGAEDLAKKVDQQLLNKYYKYDPVDLRNVSVHQMASELQNKGCIIKETGMNTQIVCSERLLTKEIEKDHNRIISTRKFIAGTVSVAVGIVVVVGYIYGLFGFLGIFDWIGIVGGIGLIVFILLNADVIKVIHGMFMVVVPLTLLFIFGQIDSSLLWVVVGVCVALIIIVGVIYYIRDHLCKQGSWICEFL